MAEVPPVPPTPNLPPMGRRDAAVSPDARGGLLAAGAGVEPRGALAGLDNSGLCDLAPPHCRLAE